MATSLDRPVIEYMKTYDWPAQSASTVIAFYQHPFRAQPRPLDLTNLSATGLTPSMLHSSSSHDFDL
jgi:hypothetical protein